MKKAIRRRLKLMISAIPFSVGVGAADAATPQDAWEAALQSDTVVAYTQYIIDNPESPLVDEAQAKIGLLSTLAGNFRVPADLQKAAVWAGQDFNESGAFARLMNI